MNTAQIAAAYTPASDAEPPFSEWCFSAHKRAFDLFGSTLLLICAAPFMLLISLSVAITSNGPVLFQQRRVGRDGHAFPILKFRTMYLRSEVGSGLTSKNDSRITPAGRILRRFKLDELPQLWNVLRGQMSLVGPRPDLPEYIDTLPPCLRSIIQLKPGITSAASLMYRDEELYLGDGPGMRERYINDLLPHKIELDLNYAQQATFLSDLRLILQTAFAVVR